MPTVRRSVRQCDLKSPASLRAVHCETDRPLRPAGETMALRAAALLLLATRANGLTSAVAPGAPTPGTSKDYTKMHTDASVLSAETAGSCDFIESDAWYAPIRW